MMLRTMRKKTDFYDMPGEHFYTGLGRGQRIPMLSRAVPRGGPTMPMGLTAECSRREDMYSPEALEHWGKFFVVHRIRAVFGLSFLAFMRSPEHYQKQVLAGVTRLKPINWLMRDWAAYYRKQAGAKPLLGSTSIQ